MATEAKREDRWAALIPRCAALLILGVLPALALTSMARKSATVDETAHLPAGYATLVTGDFRLNPEHPPLWKAVAATPLLLVDPVFLRVGSGWEDGDAWDFGRSFLQIWNRGERLLFLGRLPGVLLAMAFAWGLFAWSRSLFGPRGGLLTLALFVFDPNVLAHCRLVTTDVPFSAAFAVSLWSAARLFERVTPGRVAALAASVAAAALIKFTALLLVPILAVLAATRVFLGGPWKAQAKTERVFASASRKAALALGLAAIVAVFTYSAVWAGYGFRFSAVPEGETAPASWGDLPSDGAANATLASLHRARALPEACLRGASVILNAHRTQAPAFYLLGERSAEGWPHYFLVAFLAKTPLPVLLLIGLAVIRGRGPRPPPWVQEACWLVPVVIYAAATSVFSLNIGHRHLLPLYPLLYVGLGRMAVLPRGPRRRTSRAILAGLVALLAVTTFLRHPDYLSFFNRLVGGPQGGHHVLADSNLDWGQDLPGLREAIEERGLSEVSLAYFGTANPIAALEGTRVRNLFGRNGQSLRPGTYAISANFLLGLYLPPGSDDAYTPFLSALDEGPLVLGSRRIEHVGHVGHSIHLFRVSAIDASGTPGPGR